MAMSVKAQWIIQKMEQWAPPSTAEDWDNVGLLVGDETQAVNKVLVALDLTETVLRVALEGRFDWIITHHPLIFNPINRVTAAEPQSRKIMTLIKNGIGLYAAHTNLDIAKGGTNDLLFDLLGLTGKEPLMEPTPDGLSLGRIGFLPEPIMLKKFAGVIKETLHQADIRFAGDPDLTVQRVALCAGDASGRRYCQAAARKNCDVYITGDLRYHGVQDALDSGLALVDITHYAGEAPLIAAIAGYIQGEAEKEGLTLPVHTMMETTPGFYTV